MKTRNYCQLGNKPNIMKTRQFWQFTFISGGCDIVTSVPQPAHCADINFERMKAACEAHVRVGSLIAGMCPLLTKVEEITRDID